MHHYTWFTQMQHTLHSAHAHSAWCSPTSRKLRKQRRVRSKSGHNEITMYGWWGKGWSRREIYVTPLLCAPGVVLLQRHARSSTSTFPLYTVHSIITCCCSTKMLPARDYRTRGGQGVASQIKVFNIHLHALKKHCSVVPICLEATAVSIDGNQGSFGRIPKSARDEMKKLAFTCPEFQKDVIGKEKMRSRHVP